MAMTIATAVAMPAAMTMAMSASMAMAMAAAMSMAMAMATVMAASMATAMTMATALAMAMAVAMLMAMAMATAMAMMMALAMMMAAALTTAAVVAMLTAVVMALITPRSTTCRCRRHAAPGACAPALLFHVCLPAAALCLVTPSQSRPRSPAGRPPHRPRRVHAVAHASPPATSALLPHLRRRPSTLYPTFSGASLSVELRLLSAVLCVSAPPWQGSCHT